jgi:glycosyltransferase involved in cell wall biosynthesis
VHTNSLKAVFYGGLAARCAGIPLVAHAHDRLAEDYMPSTAIALARLAYSRLAAAVISPSQAVADTLGSDAIVIPWGAPISPNPIVPAHAFTVGIVGRIAHWKGQDVFLEAFERAFPRGEEQAVIVGEPLFGASDEAFANRLRTSVEGSTIRERVTLTGFVDDIHRELAGFDALVHASTVPEPFGQVVLEGMAAGLPVLATREGGPGELIEHGVNGLLYPAGDVVALAKLLTDLRNDAELRRRLGNAARTSAMERTPELVAERTLRVYTDVLACRSGYAGLAKHRIRTFKLS